MSKKTVLVTGCSDGGMGSALAMALNEAGFRVFASARNPAKLSEVQDRAIKTITLDIQNEESLQAAVQEVSSLTGGSLDVLINNAGVGYSIPLSDASISRSKELFDTNVWALLSTTQAFLPLLLQSKGAMVVNNTSIDSVCSAPFHGIHNASKAAVAMISQNLRLELSPFGIKVIELKTGGVKTNFFTNANKQEPKLPTNSLYGAARTAIEKSMRGEQFEASGADRHQWAKSVAKDLSKASPSLHIWRGDAAFTIWLGTFLAVNAFDGTLKKLTGVSEFEKEIKSLGRDKIIEKSGYIPKMLRRQG